MDLTHRFSVPTDVAATWQHFQDVGQLAECFPGATVETTEGDSFTGSAKVKLGPIALVYKGSGEFVERDEAAHRMVVEAKGKDKRGNGTAGATVTLTMSDAGAGTDVEVLTDLSVTGKPAQFGRGVMQDVSDKLLGQFVTCLEQRLGAPAESASEPVPPPPPPEPGPPPAPGPPPEPGPPPPPPAPGPPPPPRPRPAETDDDALDLGAAVLPVLVKSYGKQAAAGLGALAVVVLLWRLIRRG